MLFFSLPTEPHSIQAQSKPLSTSEIIDNYRFVGDFSTHPELRPNSEYLFWRYRFPFPTVSFPLQPMPADLEKLVPVMQGSGRAVEHYNIGRLHFLKGEYDQAKNIWLAARVTYGKDINFGKWLNFIIGSTYVQMLTDPVYGKTKAFTPEDQKALMANATQFLSLAMLVQRDIADERLTPLMPLQLYNIAAIYYRSGRKAATYGAAKTGLEMLASIGSSEFRLELRQLLAESYIESRSYLEAIQELDKAIRYDASEEKYAASPVLGKIFNRIGDIYYDLNNFDLAEEVYSMAAKVEYNRFDFNIPSLILRAESLFWLGNFEKSSQILEYVFDSLATLDLNTQDATHALQPAMLSQALLRLADNYLALNRKEDAKLAYFKTSHTYPNMLAGQYARIQRACLELPQFEGNNLMHARNLLEELKANTPPASEPLDPISTELAYTCHVASYSQRERTEAMLDRVRAFIKEYPDSRFLQTFIDPVAETQKNKFYAHYDAGDLHNAAEFFEKNRQRLFPTIDQTLGEIMFITYMHVGNRTKAAEFLPFSQKSQQTDQLILRSLFLSESSDLETSWSPENRQLAKKLATVLDRMTEKTMPPLFFARFLSSQAAKFHSPWLYELARQRSAQDKNYTCQIQFPILSKYKDSPELDVELKSEIDKIIGSNFPDVYAVSESCASSLLELEMRAYEKELPKLAQKYLERQSWPKKASLATLIYTVAEDVLSEKKNQQLAKQLLQMLIDGGYENAPEVTFAKARLDPYKTQTELLWQ